jgi:hypothetical protein
MLRASLFVSMLISVLFFTLFTSVDIASAGCWTSQAGCAGTVFFENRTYDKTICVRIYWFTPGHGTSNFCLSPRMSSSEWIVTGDTYCYHYKNESVPESCVRHQIWVP